MATQIHPWAISAIVGYLLYMTFIYFIVINAHVNFNVYDFTADQKAVLTSNSADAGTFLTKLAVLSSVSSGYAFVSIVTFALSIVFVIAVAYVIVALIPFA